MQIDRKALDIIRARQCITAQELAKRAGISQATINVGYRKPIDPVTIGKIAAALGVDVTEIIVTED